MTYKQTFSGGTVDLLEPTEAMIEPGVIAHELSLINRFTGDTKRAWSVAAHSLLVAELMALDGVTPWGQLYGLLHDAHEGLTGDFIAPMQQVLEAEAPGARAGLKRIQDRLDNVIFPVFGLVPAPGQAERNLMKRYDAMALALEARDLLPVGPGPGFADYLDHVAPHWREAVWPPRLATILGVARKNVPDADLKPSFVAARWLMRAQHLAMLAQPGVLSDEIESLGDKL